MKDYGQSVGVIGRLDYPTQNEIVSGKFILLDEYKGDFTLSLPDLLTLAGTKTNGDVTFDSTTFRVNSTGQLIVVSDKSPYELYKSVLTPTNIALYESLFTTYRLDGDDEVDKYYKSRTIR